MKRRAEQTALAAIVCLIAGALMLLAGVILHNRTASAGGAATLLGGAVIGFDPLAATVLGSSWMDLAIFGAVTIVIGSALDRHGVAIRLRISDWFGRRRHRDEAIALDDV